MLTFKQITTPTTETEALTAIFTSLQSLGFTPQSWQVNSIQRTFWQYVAKLYSGLTQVVADQALGMHAKLASGDFQDALGQYTFDLPRNEATRTLGTVQVSLSAAAPAASWEADEIVFADAEFAPGNSFVLTGAASLMPGQTIPMVARAEIAGFASNIAPNVPLFLWTPVAGLTITNPPLTDSSTWISTPGQEAESKDRYAARMVGRWSRLMYGANEGAYGAWVLEALPELTRYAVYEDEAVEGGVKIIGATSTGGLTEDQITTISNYLTGVTDGKGRRPINDRLSIVSADTVTTPAISLTVTCDAALSGDAASRVTTALISMFGSLPIGGEKIPPSSVGKVLASRIYQSVMGQAGIRNVTGVPADITLAQTQIYVPNITVTVITA